MPIFDFSAEYDYPYIEFSSDYIIGVDVGITNYATISIVNVKTKQIVHSTTLSQRVHSLHNSVNATSEEIKYLQIKQDNLFRNNQKNYARRLYSEIVNQRKALKNKRKELAIIAAQEIAELSYVYDNALVVIEDLSHIKNTMKFGRWNRGTLKHWLKHFVEQNGGRVFSVNAAYTSQNCHKCSERGNFKDYHTFYCKDCDLVIDRDINAAANIALRIIPDVHSKSCVTRKKAKKCKKKQLLQATPKTKQSLKYPGRDRTKNKPTPKRAKQEVKPPKKKCSVTNNDSIQMVITGETAKRPLKTLKKQHDYVNKYQEILKT